LSSTILNLVVLPVLAWRYSSPRAEVAALTTSS
jgi:hypothetical protein